MRILYIFLIFPFYLFGQVPNDECIYATDLGNISEYCSGQTEFSNVEATNSGIAEPACWFGGSSNDMWFTFRPTAPAIFLQMIGSTLDNPSVVVYSGTCGNLTEIACGSKETDNLLELSISELNIGAIYYLRVDARDSNLGSYQLCLKSFIPVPSPESDCRDAVVLCDKSPFQIENLNSVGDVKNELTGSCIANGFTGENASVWYVWTCDQAGSLTFVIEPNNPLSTEEDLDFVVYEMPGGLEDCDNREALRCMLSGEQQGAPDNSPCYGATGLAFGETDISETAGCDPGDNNFVAPIDMVSGRSYGLIINNYSKSGYGFSIEFGGTGTFLGPLPDFEIEDEGVVECDKVNTFINLSSSATDPIVNYNWTFGADATPVSSAGPGPHTAEYSSFGEKVAALTVESSRGCTVTKIIEFYVDPCCKDTTNLDVSGEVSNLNCFGDQNGEIIGQGFAGDPQYQYSLDGINYQLSPKFINLPANDYKLYIIDSKGCEDSTIVNISEPTETIVDAGPDVFLDLGESAQADGSVMTDYNIDSIYWSPLDTFLTCIDCYDPLIFPLGTTTYTITVIDENGCTSSDEVTFRVNSVRPIYIPNVFSPNNDGSNEKFNIFGGPAVKGIALLQIYDRWGNLMYDGKPKINDGQDGWDGRFKTQDVNSGVYSYLAKIEFIDKVIINYSGTVTLVR